MNIILSVIQVYTFIIIARAVSSWIPVGDNTAIEKVRQVLVQLTEPVLAPVRRVLPIIAGFDLSPLVVLIALQIIAGILASY